MSHFMETHSLRFNEWTSRNENSHYQLLIPSSYDIRLTTRDNIIRHIIYLKTEEYVDLKCDSETQSLASNDSIYQDSNSSFSSNSSFNSSASSKSSQKKFKRKTNYTTCKNNKKAKNQKRHMETEDTGLKLVFSFILF